MAPPGLVGPNWAFAISTEDQFEQAAAAVVWALAGFNVTAEAILAALVHDKAQMESVDIT